MQATLPLLASACTRSCWRKPAGQNVPRITFHRHAHRTELGTHEGTFPDQLWRLIWVHQLFVLPTKDDNEKMIIPWDIFIPPKLGKAYLTKAEAHLLPPRTETAGGV